MKFTDEMGYVHDLAIEQLHWPRIIRTFRKKHRLTQQRLADLLPLASKRNVQDWEQGVHRPPLFLTRALRDLSREIEKTTK
jgi:DNA-binding transcriptional regulator YiaG